MDDYNFFHLFPKKMTMKSWRKTWGLGGKDEKRLCGIRRGKE